LPVKENKQLSTYIKKQSCINYRSVVDPLLFLI